MSYCLFKGVLTEMPEQIVGPGDYLMQMGIP
jgi:hypothetical protein